MGPRVCTSALLTEYVGKVLNPLPPSFPPNLGLAMKAEFLHMSLIE